MQYLALLAIASVSTALPAPQGGGGGGNSGPPNGIPGDACSSQSDCLPTAVSCWFYKTSAKSAPTGICRAVATYEQLCGGSASIDPLSASVPVISPTVAALSGPVCANGFTCTAVAGNHYGGW
ncbi:hypothetical protein HDU98_005269, partial [Podochytrium sp. JEL0797]